MTTLMPTAAARQPFAPINGSRLQNMTSVKNRQNAIQMPLTSPVKRKAAIYEDDNSENIDPVFLSPKRNKGPSDFSKPTNTFLLTKAPPSPHDFNAAPCSPIKPFVSSRPMLQPRSPAPKLTLSSPSSGIEKTLSAPAGRSPTRKRIGILNRRRTSAGSPFTRVDPPSFSLSAAQHGAAAPFSIAAALSGTIPSYGARQAARATPVPASTEPAPIIRPEGEAQKDSWFFAIHEDTEEETMQILMEHSTCTLDISSDEETEARRRDDRGKENVPPMDDISQSQSRLPREMPAAKGRSRRATVEDENAIEVDRAPLGDLEAEEFYAPDCSAKDVVVVAEDVEEGVKLIHTFDFVAPAPGLASSLSSSSVPPQEPILEHIPEHVEDVVAEEQPVEQQLEQQIMQTVDQLMQKSDAEAPEQAALFSPIEKAEEGFVLWESGSAKGDDEL